MVACLEIVHMAQQARVEVSANCEDEYCLQIHMDQHPYCAKGTDYILFVPLNACRIIECITFRKQSTSLKVCLMIPINNRETGRKFYHTCKRDCFNFP